MKPLKPVKPVALTTIIDDDESYVFALERMLQLFKISQAVISFPHGKEGLDYLTMVKDYPHQLPDIIFLDINMPNMNGWKFLEDFAHLKSQLSKNISIYMLSSSISFSDVQRARSYPSVSDYYTKPIYKADLVKILEFHQEKPHTLVE